MASTTTRNTRAPNFILSPHQQNLLFAALNSNKVPALDTSLQQTSTDSLPLAFDESPLHETPTTGSMNRFEESPFIDYDYDFEGDGNFGDYDFANVQGQMIGNLPGTSSDGEAGAHDKRSHSEDDEDDNDGGGKRREGDDKSSKKPGRKPLTSEPTSKRKAQNRAAQRAFRERKEKHLKDLETKVQDLEKASESANHENSMLRAQVEKMSVELKEYRKRLSSAVNVPNRAATLNGGLPPYLGGTGIGSNTLNNPNDVNFQFEFPRFGRLPGPPTGKVTSGNAASPAGPSPRGSLVNNSSVNALDQTLQNSPSFVSTNNNSSFSNTTNDMAQFSALFALNPLDNISKDTTFDYMSHVGSTASRSSVDYSNGRNSTGQSTSHSSPSVSSVSNNGLSSSAGTSPEPFTQSPPALKHSDGVLGTIGEESQDPSTTKGSVQTPGFDVNGIDWFAQQNGNQFDPQLFGDYREPQESILSNGFYDDTFFNEAFALPEFNSPFTLEASPAPKKDLVTEIDAKLIAEEDVVPGEPHMLTCTNMWEKLQACPRVQNGEIDMDSLCSQLQQKAKCSGDGPVIQEKDFKEVMSSMFPTGMSPY